MKLHVLDIPEDPAELPHWLERHLVGLDLAALVAELSAVHQAPWDARHSVRDVLEERLGAVLSGGLGGLPTEAIGRLLRQPRLLLELQELVLARGSAYWDQVAPPSYEDAARITRGRARLEEFLTDGGSSQPSGYDLRPQSPTIVWYRRPWVVSLSSAAAMLVTIIAYNQIRPPAPTAVAVAPTGWGWGKPDALPQDLPTGAYLNRLADAAEEWFKIRPSDAPALARRIGEFRQGCSVLILAEHKPLSAEDRKWLVEKCRVWALKLDMFLVAVEAGNDPKEVKTEIDETIHKLIETIRERAKGA